MVFCVAQVVICGAIYIRAFGCYARRPVFAGYSVGCCAVFYFIRLLYGNHRRSCKGIMGQEVIVVNYICDTHYSVA